MKQRLFLFVATGLLFASCAPVTVRIITWDHVPSEYLYDQSLMFLNTRGYTLKTANKTLSLLEAEITNTAGQATDQATIWIRPAGWSPRIDATFTSGAINEYRGYMAQAVARYRHR
ncbi:hypothetical protein DEDE109153_16385 [Deinococcus deserti]|uniref:Lipoprotein n=1 Tax=Deinococcus deserti (strain DSM 17065 / CIP 109153 / LMG 22923 / VCD115) TaxID=546414 RepID=C1D293_DEIDV|nr:hypothetical protein [Deinococcus deserti]ACO47532.1 Hypothetical protein, precursor [Deinococcus deserti VCD115]